MRVIVFCGSSSQLIICVELCMPLLYDKLAKFTLTSKVEYFGVESSEGLCYCLATLKKIQRLCKLKYGTNLAITATMVFSLLL